MSRQEDEDRERFEEERRREADVRRKLDLGLANALTEWILEVARPYVKKAFQGFMGWLRRLFA